MSNLPFGATVVSGDHYVSLWGQYADSSSRRYQVWIDGELRATVDLSPYYLPGIAVGTTHVAIWAGRHAFLCSLTGDSFRSLELSSEIHVAYPIEERWCFVCELSVVVFDVKHWVELAHYDHGEVLGRSWWSGDQLIVEDFQGRHLPFYPKAEPLNLTP